ncbi:MAG: MFS transporter [Chloroflexi bacterium]|nr:MFS transporter [Chloroflexota bacterium]
MFPDFKRIYHQFPIRFWIVVLASFISGIGGTLLFPFFALYITQKFSVGMTTAGIILGLFSVFGLVGGMIGGALADKFGRRVLIISGLIFGSISTIALGLVTHLIVLYPLAVVIGILNNIGGPAQNAMVADILPEEKRQEGFGVLRVVGNLAWIIGPTIGGFVANRSYFLLFVTDAVLSCVVAAIFFRFVPETKPEEHAETKEQSILQTMAGYKVALRDYAFMAFLVASILMMVVYQQAYNTLSVYLRNYHGIDPQGYGFLLTSSAITVVLLQFWITRRVKNLPPFALMAVGTILYAIGFGMFGFVSAYALFVTAVVIITFGEMIIVPTSQALTANFAPEEMRGRYMAVYGFSWSIPSAIGPGAAGYILDNYNPNLVWYIGGILCLVAALGFYFLHVRLGHQQRFIASVPEEEAVPA